jgi:hypothetical protein
MEDAARPANCLKILHALGVRNYKTNFRGDLSAPDFGVHFVDYYGTLTLNLTGRFFEDEGYGGKLGALALAIESYQPTLTRVDSAHDVLIESEESTGSTLRLIWESLETNLKSVLYFGKGKALETISISTALCGARIYDRAAAAVHFKKANTRDDVGKVIRIEAFLRTKKAIPQGDWLGSLNSLMELTVEVDKILFQPHGRKKKARIVLPKDIDELLFCDAA